VASVSRCPCRTDLANCAYTRIGLAEGSDKREYPEWFTPRDIDMNVHRALIPESVAWRSVEDGGAIDGKEGLAFHLDGNHARRSMT